MTGATLRAIREAAGWEQQQLAAILGVQPVTAWRWEQAPEVPQYVAVVATLIAASKRNRELAERFLTQPQTDV
jgi:transcriptional regulator with XRE-family HTH domain